MSCCLGRGVLEEGSWKRGLVGPLWKGKGDRQDSNNGGVKLLSVPGKFFAQVSIDRVHHHLLVHQHPE